MNPSAWMILSKADRSTTRSLITGKARRPGIRVTPLEPPGVHRTIAVAWRRDFVPTHAGRELRRCLLEYVYVAPKEGALPAGVARV